MSRATLGFSGATRTRARGNPCPQPRAWVLIGTGHGLVTGLSHWVTACDTCAGILYMYYRIAIYVPISMIVFLFDSHFKIPIKRMLERPKRWSFDILSSG